MGQVCAKNDAGRVATDAPKTTIKKNDRELVSQQSKPATQPQTEGEKKFVSANVNFNLDKGVDKKPDIFAADFANKWCDENPDWTYTGTWKNERNGDIEVSHFEVCKKTTAKTTESKQAD